jgi:hypothetical protein
MSAFFAHDTRITGILTRLLRASADGNPPAVSDRECSKTSVLLPLSCASGTIASNDFRLTVGIMYTKIKFTKDTLRLI